MSYTLARLGLFVGALAILLFLGFDWVWGAVFATLISLSLSVLVLGKLRQRAADALRRRVEKPAKDVDSDIEDRQLGED